MKKKGNGLFGNSLFYVAIVIFAVVAWALLTSGGSGSRSETVKTTEFMNSLNQGDVKSFSIQPSNGVLKVTGEYKHEKTSSGNSQANFGLSSGRSTKVKYFQTSILGDDSTVSAVNKAASKTSTKFETQQESQSGAWLQYLFLFGPIILILVFFYLMMNQSGQGGGTGRVMSFGRSKAKASTKKDIKVRFSDVAGEEEEKQELVEVVDFLKDPKKYQSLGARIPSGVLLEGPPGTGKTLLAKAVAGEANVPFFSISGSEFVEMFVGVGASRVRDLFEKAKSAAPAIIFIDEIDAVGRQRGAGLGGGHDEREQTLNQLLVEMDGFDGTEGVIVIAATNRSDVLDPALLRPGRFDRKILVGRPDIKGREAILKVHARNKPIDKAVDFKEIAKETPGFVGADLENVLNEAALIAARRNKKIIDATDLDEAEDRVIAGVAKKNRVISPRQRRIIAFHESGHATVGLVLSNSQTVRKVTIVPRGQAGGYAIMLPKDDDSFILTREELNEQIIGLLGGRTSEEIFFHEESTGASNDFEQATSIAHDMITKYGMTSEIGTVALEKQGQPFVGADYGQAPVYSQETAAKIDKEIKRIINEAHDEARNIISEHKEQVTVIAEALLKYETLDEKEILSLYNTGKLPEGDQHLREEEDQAKSFEDIKKEVNSEGNDSPAPEPTEPNPGDNPENSDSNDD
ncbi:ATP-dependent zinc metalloprotease FtsH [Xylocopilactobacillus apis]|uniref:ATP-dependent zinc metalloprotease FtsH n=1 Tax=Xylocopilactobacillus apis TaxID=2932183 RepID=A0AAU9CYD0_9LACO|nr:ATP-dependent zinc metalloprotease FtsH [Xylocopilactobacillus apis]BDR56248.1 ATP-dependent zinc metalloprotease FtsH [Xylocopilactobacillus apis]